MQEKQEEIDQIIAEKKDLKSEADYANKMLKKIEIKAKKLNLEKLKLLSLVQNNLKSD